MEMWGSSYLIQDVEPVRLIGIIGASTETGAGSVRVSFNQDPGVFAVTQSGSEGALVVKWDVALRLMALLHIVILQNKILRGEAPEIGIAPCEACVFTVSGGGRGAPVTCSWDAAKPDVEYKRVTEGASDQFELVLTEKAAIELAADLAGRIAANGATTAIGGDP